MANKDKTQKKLKKNKKIPKNGGLTPNEILVLKREAKTDSVFLIEVKHGKELLFFWVKKPDMPTLSAVAAIAEADPMKASQIMFKNCLIKGDVSYADDVDVFPAIAEQLSKTMQVATSKLKKF